MQQRVLRETTPAELMVRTNAVGAVAGLQCLQSACICFFVRLTLVEFDAVSLNEPLSLFDKVCDIA